MFSNKIPTLHLYFQIRITMVSWVYALIKCSVALPLRGLELSRWLISREQGLRVTAVVTDSYGLSSSSGRKTSRDGEVTISVECFESCERKMETYKTVNTSHYPE